MTKSQRTASSPSSWRTIAAIIAPYRARLAVGLVWLLLTNGLDKSIPWLLKSAIDELTAQRFEQVAAYALCIVLLAVSMGITRTLSRVKVFYVGRDVEFELRNKLLARLQLLGPSFFQRMPTGETMSRAINDLAQVRAMVAFGLLHLVNSILAYVIALAFMVSMSWELTLWALLPYPLLVVASRWAGRALYVRSRDAQEALGELAARVQETLSGIRLVRAFTNEDFRRERFEEANQNALRRNMSLVVLRGFMWPFLMGVGALGMLLVLFRGTAMVRAETLTIGELVGFLAYVNGLSWPTMGLGYILSVVQRGRASHARIAEILEAEPDVVEAIDAVDPGNEGDLLVRDLSYAYGNQRVLDGVSFHVPAGGSLAIVGRTGSGKSTLAALLPRLLDTPKGTVFLDGRDITELKLRPLRRTVGYAQQDPFLFSNTIARNIGYRFEDPYTDSAASEIRRVAKEASVLDEIEDLAAGFDTVVGERGVQLSGGQKQRLALARALLNEPRVLVMDDPLSAVDAKTEAAILEALERAGEGRTLLLITNRVAAAARCDRVIVLEEGRVVEEGDHRSLLGQGGAYAQLASRQRLEEELTAL